MYEAKLEGTNYAVYYNGERISTGTASSLKNYGLSETQLTSNQPAPTAIGTQTTQQSITQASPTYTPVLSVNGQPTAAATATTSVSTQGLTAIPKGPADLYQAYSVSQDILSKLPPGTSTIVIGGRPYMLNGNQAVENTGGAPSWTFAEAPSFDTSGKQIGGAGFTAPTPASTPITDPVDATGAVSGTLPDLPDGIGGNTAAAYTTSLTEQQATQQAAFDAENAKRIADYQTQIDALNKQLQDFEALQEAGLGETYKVMQQEVLDKKAELELEKQRFDENYNANQQLIGELSNLLTEGNTLIKQMQETTGLASIMNPRISKTMSDVAARAGVIEAVISARNGQMSYAQQQLNTAVNTIDAIAQDQINYYTTLIDFYEMQSDDLDSKVTTLTKEQKVYLDAKLIQLENDLNTTKATALHIQEAMLDPQTALDYARAGVTLNDSVATINQKLARSAYSQELSNISNTMSENGYSTIPIAGVTPVMITDSLGKQKAWYKKPDQLVEGGSGTTLEGNEMVGLTPTVKNKLLGVGYTTDQINHIQEGVNKEGFPAVYEAEKDSGTSPEKLRAIQDAYGVTPTFTVAEIKADMQSAYTKSELQQISDDLGYAKWYTGAQSDIDRMFASATVDELLGAIKANPK